MYLQDTIVASATPPGTGAVAIVRLSGPRAFAILDSIWRPIHPGEMVPRKMRLGDVIDPETGARVDRVLAVVMPRPASLTGEDVAELQCHGGQFVVRRIIALATDAGARIAEPGEFTRRAFLNVRIYLAEAEAIDDIVAARSDSALAQALTQLSGALSERVEGLRQQLIAIRAHLEVEIDFSDEDVELPERRRLANQVGGLIDDVALLHDSFVRGRIVRHGVRATIVGKPNAGKSSILNLILGTDRAIVTPIAGTTRDVIEESVSIPPYALVMSDTAGIRDLRNAVHIDAVERIGMERTTRSAADADLLIAVFDSSRPIEREDLDVIAMLAKSPAIALLNKQDLPPVLSAATLSEKIIETRGQPIPILPFSAIDAGQLGPLRAELIKAIESMLGGTSGDTISISRERHRDSLAIALEALRSASIAIATNLPPEIVAVDIAAATDALGAITGQVSSEDILDAIFREFCIGK
jgi:tRNA modification GTPase